MYGLLDHPWWGTQHCLRLVEPWVNVDGAMCCNDHTGCLWNDGHNECMHPNKSKVPFDAPLRQKEKA